MHTETQGCFYPLTGSVDQRNGQYQCHCPLVCYSSPCFTFGPTAKRSWRYLLTCQPRPFCHLSPMRFMSLDSMSSIYTSRSPKMSSLVFCLAAFLCPFFFLQDQVDGWVNDEAVGQGGSASFQRGLETNNRNWSKMRKLMSCLDDIQSVVLLLNYSYGFSCVSLPMKQSASIETGCM